MLYGYGTAQRIVDWNHKRNILQFDANLEAQLLNEEVQEFYNAISTLERLHEFCDFLFVAQGTYAKLLTEDMRTLHSMSYMMETLDPLNTYIQAAYKQMKTILYDELLAVIPSIDEIDRLVAASLACVCDANEAKTAEKNADGKIVKGQNYTPPKEAIRELLQSTLEAYDALSHRHFE